MSNSLKIDVYVHNYKIGKLTKSFFQLKTIVKSIEMNVLIRFARIIRPCQYRNRCEVKLCVVLNTRKFSMPMPVRCAIFFYGLCVFCEHLFLFQGFIIIGISLGVLYAYKQQFEFGNFKNYQVVFLKNAITI